MPKYFVSLACKVPLNFEVEVEAKNEKEAQAKAEDLFDDADNWEDNLREPDFSELQLDIGMPDNSNAGVYIEKI